MLFFFFLLLFFVVLSKEFSERACCSCGCEFIYLSNALLSASFNAGSRILIMELTCSVEKPALLSAWLVDVMVHEWPNERIAMDGFV